MTSQRFSSGDGAARVVSDLIQNNELFVYRMSLPDGRYEYVSQGCAAVTGYSPEDFYANPKLIEEFIHPAWQSFFRQAWERLVAGHAPPQYEYAIHDRAGRTRWLRQQNVVIRGADGAPTAIEGLVTDVTADVEVQEELEALVYERSKALQQVTVDLHQEVARRARALTEARECEAQLRVMADHLPAAVSYVDAERRYRFVNVVYEQWFGHSRSRMIGASLPEVLGEAAYEHIAGHVDTALAGRPVSFEAPIPYEHGGTRYVRASYVPHWDEAHRHVLGFFVLVSDISAEKQAEAAERRHLLELAHLARISSVGETASHLVHEVTQPVSALTAYLGACRTLLRKGDLEELSRALDEMATGLEGLRNVVRGFRRFLRKGELHRQAVAVPGLLHRVVELIRWESESRGTPIELRLPDGLPQLRIDGALVEQVVLNLLRNALDATDRPGSRNEPIRVAAVRRGAEVEISVEDRGIGLSAEAKAKLFEPFFTTKAGGVGIGLVISRRIVESHGGRLWAEDGAEGRGARFAFTLPVEH